MARLTFKTAHYSFEYNPEMIHPVMIKNRDGKEFFVMADELMKFVRFVELSREIGELEALRDRLVTK